MLLSFLGLVALAPSAGWTIDGLKTGVQRNLFIPCIHINCANVIDVFIWTLFYAQNLNIKFTIMSELNSFTALLSHVTSN
jgi:hypothetical protein